MDGFWRLLTSVRETERGRFAFFFSLAALVTMGQTVGLIGAESLFLARFGVEYLPQTFIFASGATVAGMLLYAALVGALRNDKLFVYMLVVAAFGLGAATLGTATGGALWLPGLLALYYLTNAVFVSHYWTFAGDYFDILASKRLFHLFTLGMSTGGMVGGGLAVGLSRIAPPETLIAAWAVILLATGVMIRLGRRGLIRWGLIELAEEDETSLEGTLSAVRYLRRSSLARWLAISAVGMTIALFLSQYLYSQRFVETFPTTRELATFLGLVLALGNLGEVAIEFVVTPFLDGSPATVGNGPGGRVAGQLPKR